MLPPVRLLAEEGPNLTHLSGKGNKAQ